MRFGVRFSPPIVALVVLSGTVMACLAPQSPPRSRSDGPTTEPGPGSAGDQGNGSRAAGETEERPPPWLAARCTEADPALAQVAVRAARGELPGQDSEAVMRALRVAGGSYVGPRCWMFSGPSIDPVEADARLSSWLGRPVHPARRHCGVAFVRSIGQETAAMIVVDSLAEPASLPMTARSSSWVRFGADIQVVPRGAKVVVLGPTRAPQAVPTSISGKRISALVRLDQPGVWLLQLLVDAGHGPLPALEAVVFADVEPSEDLWLRPVPGEQESVTAEPGLTAAIALWRMINEARASAGLAPVSTDAGLEAIASRHARAMRRLGQLAHDTGQGDPTERAARAGVNSTVMGENLAHAATAVLAHRALWYSPSHRMNLLDTRFGRVGIGVDRDGDGSLWIAELFASGR